MTRASNITVIHGDSRDKLKDIADASIDSVVTDPPYALVSIGKRFGKPGSTPAKSEGASGVYARASAGFMGQTWDTGETAFAVEFWAEVYRVLRPGGHVVAFGGTRTVHRMTVAIEDAGFEIRDRLTEFIESDGHVASFMASLNDEQRGAFIRCIEESQFGGQLAFCFGTGFPKSHDVSKGIDRAAGAERPVVGSINRQRGGSDDPTQSGGRNYRLAGGLQDVTSAATDAARQWEGWGTALKPALEPIVLARKPLIGTVVENVLAHGTGALNIDACRVEGVKPKMTTISGNQNNRILRTRSSTNAGGLTTEGRWPANIVHDGSDEVVEAFPMTSSGFMRAGTERKGERAVYGQDAVAGAPVRTDTPGDSGSAARFFYTAKADAEDRLGSKHPTVKPIDLMAWLCRLVTPPKVVEWVCETCNNTPHGDGKLQDLQQAAKPQETDGVLLSGVPCDGTDEAATAVQDVRETSQSSDAGVLLTNLPSGGGTRRREDADAATLRVVRDRVQTEEERGATLLQPSLRLGGGGLGEAETEDTDGSRVLAGLPARTSDGVEDRLRDGAPPHHGRDDRQTTQGKRGGSPHQRGQGRQPAREPRTDDEAGARPHAEVAQESGAQLSPLSGPDHPQQLCAHCGGQLTRTERPGVVLDPFAGTGTTGIAAMREGFDCILIEREAAYVADIERRIAWARGEGRLTALEKARDVDEVKARGEDLPLFGGAE